MRPSIHEFLVWCDDLGISVVTLYLLSTDNLTGRTQRRARRPVRDHRRPRRRPLALPRLASAARRLAPRACRRSWSPRSKGAEERTASNTGLHINLAVGYGGRARDRGCHAQHRAQHHDESGGTLDALAEILTPELIAEHLYTGGQPDPDLVIRTSGEQRLSDFMLWQSAHSEFYFVEALGPDLREVDFLRALRDFATRERRFGQMTEMP